MNSRRGYIIAGIIIGLVLMARPGMLWAQCGMMDGSHGGHSDHSTGDHTADHQTGMATTAEVTSGSVRMLVVLPPMAVGESEELTTRLTDARTGMPISRAVVSVLIERVDADRRSDTSHTHESGIATEDKPDTSGVHHTDQNVAMSTGLFAAEGTRGTYLRSLQFDTDGPYRITVRATDIIGQLVGHTVSLSFPYSVQPGKKGAHDGHGQH